MKHLWAALKLMVILLLLVQCGPHRYPQQLSQLDALADSLPDEAVALMRKVEPQMKDASEWDRRYFQLLSIKVSDKADLPLPSDTVAWELVQYYEEEGDPQLLPMAYYYAARICRSRNDAPQALDYLLKANDLLADSHSHLKAVVNSQMGYIFSEQKLHHNAAEAFIRAYYCDSINHDTIGMIYNLRDIGFEIENPDSVSMYLSTALNLAKEKGSDEFIANISAQLANYMYKEGKLDSARSLIQVAIDYNDPQDQSAVNSIAAKIYEKLDNMEDSALYHYNQLIKLNYVFAKGRGYRGLFEHSFKRKALDSAFTYFQQYKSLSDSILNITATETVARMHASYNYQMREKENIKLKDDLVNKNRIAFIATIIAISTIALLVVIYYKMRSKSIKLKANLEKLKLLQEEAKIKNEKQIKENLDTISKLELEITKLDVQDKKQKDELLLLKKKLEYSTELAIIAQKEEKNTLLKLEEVPIYQYIVEANGSPKEKVRCLSEKEWEDLSKAIDTFYPQFKKSLLSFYPLKVHEYHVCMLIKLKVNPIIIAALTAHSKESITATRRRLYYKSFGEVGTPKNWDEFVLSV